MQSSVSGDSALSLLVRLKADDAIAWQEMVEIYAPLIFHWCRNYRLDAADSADVMQEVFSAVSRSISKYRVQDGGSFRGWLWTITQNKIRDHLRKKDRQFVATGGTTAQIQMGNVLDPFDDVSHETMTSEIASKDLVQRALALIQVDFQPQTWQAFWKSTVEGKNTADIAQELGLSSNGVRQAKSRVLRRLREQLGDS